jgi:hypothetical protein
MVIIIRENAHFNEGGLVAGQSFRPGTEYYTRLSDKPTNQEVAKPRCSLRCSY